MSTLISSPDEAPRETVRGAIATWARTDGVIWIYILKTVIAALLSLLIAMRLDLPQPRTAMTTVFILMQPQSGMVLAKSFYRFGGTLVGLAVMLVLIALFSQQPVLFLSSTALWVGICTAGAARNRNFRSYGFVLAGYTAALIGIPAGQSPDGAFLTALTRVAEVSVGILCSGAVSALIFPRYAGEQIRTAVRKRFSGFVDYVSKALAGQVDRPQIEAANAAFIADIVSFEAARSVAVFEQPETRMRSGRFARLNSEFMSASTRFHALLQLMNRLRMNGATHTLHALEPYFHEVAPLLKKSGAPVLDEMEASVVAAQLEEFKTALPKRIPLTRARLETLIDAPLIEFDTASELLYRFVDHLHAYVQTYASLATPSHERERWVNGYAPKTNMIAALSSGMRAALVMLALSTFWLVSAWPSGGILVLGAGAVCALASSSPRPAQMVAQMTVGTVLAAVAGYIVVFVLYPRLDGFILLSAGLVPFLMLGTFLSTRKGLVGIGVGYCIFFCFLAGPDNVISYDPTSFINNAIALALAMAIVTIFFAVLLPTDAPWLRHLLLAELRRQVVTTCSARLTGLAFRFESRTRDLLYQLNALGGARLDLRGEALGWLFAVLETGHSVIDLRFEVRQLQKDRHSVARESTIAMLDGIARLFDRPDVKRFNSTLLDTDRAIDEVRALLTSEQPVSDGHPRLQRMLSHLHFIRTALLDPQSPFAPFAKDARNMSEGTPHAS